MRPAHRTVLVTGGSRGIGAGIALLFGARGWNVVLTYVAREGAADEIVAAIQAGGGTARAVRCDTRIEHDVISLFASMAAAKEVPDAVINNAGITGPRTRLEDLALDALRDVIDVNLVGVILCCREAARLMSTRRGGLGGVIVNISSTGTKLGNPGQWVHYAATKGAIDVLTNGLARELAADDIRVAAVAPGLMLTDLAHESQVRARLDMMKGEIPMSRPGTVSEVAEGVYWLASDAASYCTGVVLPIAGGR